MCRRKAEGRYQQRRGGCFRHVRPLPIALMQKWPKLTQKEIKQFQKAKIRNLSLHMHLHGSYFGICLELKRKTRGWGCGLPWWLVKLNWFLLFASCSAPRDLHMCRTHCVPFHRRVFDMHCHNCFNLLATRFCNDKAGIWWDEEFLSRLTNIHSGHAIIYII